MITQYIKPCWACRDCHNVYDTEKDAVGCFKSHQIEVKITNKMFWDAVRSILLEQESKREIVHSREFEARSRVYEIIKTLAERLGLK